MGFTCSLAQCIPEPLSRASTTSLLALSTAPLPIGYPLAWNSAYLICPRRFSRYSRLPLTALTASDCLDRPAVRPFSLRQLPAQRPQIVEHLFRLSVFQLVQLNPQPLAGGYSPRSESGLTRLGQVLCGMAPVQNPHRVRPVQVDESLLRIPAATRPRPSPRTPPRHSRCRAGAFPPWPAWRSSGGSPSGKSRTGPGRAPLLPGQTPHHTPHQTPQWSRWPGSSPHPIPRATEAPSLHQRSVVAAQAPAAPPPSPPPAPLPALSATPPRLPRSSQCSGAPWLPRPLSCGSAQPSSLLGQRASNCPAAPGPQPDWASGNPAPDPVLHPGGKNPVPQPGHTP